MELRFLRDTDKREIDFVVQKDGQPQFAVECKTGERNVNPSIFYFKKRTKISEYYQVHKGEKDYIKDGVRVLPVQTFCSELQLP